MSSDVFRNRSLPIDQEDFEGRLRAALRLKLDYFERPLEFEGRPAAVLLLLAWDGDSSGGPSVLLSRRTESVETHKGQIAFPGGVMDPEDADAVAAALRETKEEVGISPDLVRVIGELPRLWTVTGFWITPIVGILQGPRERVRITPNPDEIAEVFWIPVNKLIEPGIYHEEQYPIGRKTYPIHVFQVKDWRVWGATGAILKNFLDRMDSLG